MGVQNYPEEIKMKVENYRLSKPYPMLKIAKDGNDLVFSFFCFYLRMKGAV